MRIHYDHQAFSIQEYGGISRYFYELVRQFQSYPHIEVSNSVLFSNNEYIRRNKFFRPIPFFKCIKLQKRIKTMILLNEFKSMYTLKRDEFDLFHPTYYDTYYLKVKSKKPVVITFHDLIHEKFKQYDQITLSNKKKVLNRADQIISVSQSSKNDLIEHFNIPAERIKVIHLASSISFPEDIIKEPSGVNYLLYVGGRNDYKNFLFFVTAIVPLLQKHPDLFLYCSGGGRFTKDEQKLFKELKVEHKIKYHPATDDHLKRLYSNALAFFFPSIYEGFGLPLLEAMNCGCPIGASQTSSFPEVSGDAALYFNPHDKESILSVAEILINSPQFRAELRQKGFLRAKEFSWQKTAMKTYDLYKTLA